MAAISVDAKIPMSGTSEGVENPQQSHRGVMLVNIYIHDRLFAKGANSLRHHQSHTVLKITIARHVNCYGIFRTALDAMHAVHTVMVEYLDDFLVLVVGYRRCRAVLNAGQALLAHFRIYSEVR